MKAQRGVGLVEILVAVVILSIGFLAVARMQVAGMRFSQSAYFRSQAAFMANDMADRMRANISGVNAGAYASKATAADTPDPDCQSNACNPSELAAQDLHDWSALLHPAAGAVAVLPSSSSYTARGEIEPVAADGSWSITVYWAETIAGDTREESLSVNFVGQS